MPLRRRVALIALALAVAIGGTVAVLSRAALGEFLFVDLLRNLAEAATPQGGERVLPLPVQHMIALLRRNQVERYRASPRILHDPGYEQRILEGAWPIRRMADSTWYVALADEALPAGCQSVDRLEDAVLARCP
jgi:hypothetical protein